jgi:hypothetical protein
VSATVTTMPNTRVLHIPAFDAMTRKVLLAGMAINLIEDPARLGAADVAVLLAAYAAESYTPEAREEAWEKYLACVREKQDAADRPIKWLGMPRGTTGLQMARNNAQTALDFLVFGTELNGGK